MPEWVYTLLDQFGVKEDILDSDEMPPEIARLLPMAKGFVESGGLSKIFGAGATGGQPSGGNAGGEQAW